MTEDSQTRRLSTEEGTRRSESMDRVFFDTNVSLEGMLDCEIEDAKREYGTLENYASMVLEGRVTELLWRCTFYDIIHPFDVLIIRRSKTDGREVVYREPSLACFFRDELYGDDVSIYSKGGNLYLEHDAYICRILYILPSERREYPNVKNRYDDKYLETLLEDKKSLSNPDDGWYTYAQRKIDEDGRFWEGSQEDSSHDRV